MKRYLLTVLAAGCFAITASAQTWFNARTLPPGKPSAEPALSYDGSHIYWAWDGGLILSSTNFGVAWQTNTIDTVTNIYSIAISTNGANVVLAGNNGIYYSSNFGYDYTKTTAPAQQWNSVAVSADGSKIVAADITGTNGLYRSADSGQTWTQIKSGAAFEHIASSADGAILVASGVQFLDKSIISKDSGATWNELPINSVAVAISSDGSKMIAAPRTTHSNLLTSTNTGATWLDDNGFGGSTFFGVGISADGAIPFAHSSAVVRHYEPRIPGWLSDSFTGITSAGISGDGKFMVVSYAAAIGIYSAERPIIVRNPVTLTVWPRTNINFTASVTGALPITYRWTFNDEPVGASSPLLQWTATNSGTIKLTAENAFGTDTITHTILNVLPIGARMNLTAAVDWPFAAAVAPGESEAAVWFEWGVSNRFDHATAATNIPAGPFKAVSVAAPNMPLGVYNVRVVASNSLAVTTSSPTRYVPAPITAGMDTGARVTFSPPNFHWFEQGYVSTNRALGLPHAGEIFTSESENGSYQMPPDYGAPNALLIDSLVTTGSLQFVTPAAYSKLSFLTAAGSGDVGIRYMLHHADGSAETGIFTSNDWFGSTNTAHTAGARVSSDIFTPLSFPTTLWRVFIETPGNPRLYGRTVTVTNNASPITSIDFLRASGSGHAAIFAVSGSTGAALAPIEITGFTEDMIIEAEFSGLPRVNFALESGATLHALPGVQYDILETETLGYPWTLVETITSETEQDILFAPTDRANQTHFYLIRPR